MINEITYEMKSGALNQIYDKVKNCKVIKPPYEGEEGIYNVDFFLDKRDGCEWFKEHTGFSYTDKKKINGVYHYLYNDGSDCYVGIENGEDITEIAGPFPIDETSPKQMGTGFGGAGELITSGTITNPISEAPTDSDLQYYGDGWVKLTLSSVTGVAVGQYIQFQDGVLKGGSNKIYKVDGSSIYIIGTNTRGSLPIANATYKIFAEKQENLIVGGSDGLYLISPNGTSSAEELKIVDHAIDDIVDFNGVLFTLYGNEMFFSRRTFDDNVQFYPIDKFPGRSNIKLLPLGKILLSVGAVNKIYAPATGTDNTIGYVEYDVNYQGEIFSDYAFMYADSTFYMVQKDKQIKQMNVVTLNTTSYDIEEKEIDTNTRGIFEDIEGGEIYFDHNDRYINVCNIYNGATTIYQYDKQYNHWIIHNIAKEIYSFGDRILTNGGVGKHGGDTDFGEIFKQEINFMLNEKNRIPFIWIMRTQIGLPGDKKIDVDLDIQYHIGADLVTLNKKYNNYLFDATMDNVEIDDLIGYDDENMYTGNTVSLQKNIFRAGRFFKFKFHSENRFMIGETYMVYKNSKFFINEILQSN